MTIKERAAYIKGMMEGMNFTADSDEKKLISAIIDLVSDMADEIEDIHEDSAYVNDYVEELDEDLASLEEFVYDEDDDLEDDDDEYDLCETECDCGSFIEISCENIKDGKLVCPDCGKEYDLEEICGSCDDCEGCH